MKRILPPPPDLQALCALHGGYHLIPHDELIEHEARFNEWRQKLREGCLPVTYEPEEGDEVIVPAPTPELACGLCERFGEYGYIEGGRMLWTCREHRLRFFSSDAKRKLET